jgi:citrate synthase
VKKETVYAYVSRGLLTSERRRGSKTSYFDADEVTRLAARARRGGRAGGLEVVIDSGVTLLDPAGQLFFRGWSAVEASRTASYEEVAAWLWEVADPVTAFDRGMFRAAPSVLAVTAPAVRSLPSSATPIDRYLVALPTAAALDPYRHNRDPAAVAERAGRMIAMLVESLPVVVGSLPVRGESPTVREESPTVREEPVETSTPDADVDSLALRLWRRLSTEEPSDASVLALNAALVLLADHELATSTLAARVAASTWADIYRVVMTGLAALGGPLHGAVGDHTVGLLDQAVAEGAEAAVSAVMRSGRRVPGFGHLVYEHADPRAAELLGRVRAAWPDHPVVTAADGVVTAVTGEHPETFPNVDFALATLVSAGGMVRGAAEGIFATARIAGFVAHAIEEYRHALRFRTRAAYTGPDPDLGLGGDSGSGSRFA